LEAPERRREFDVGQLIVEQHRDNRLLKCFDVLEL
jgi:hypothetical protein